MGRDRTPWVAMGLLLTSVSSLVLGISAMNGFGNAPSGDMAASSASGATTLLIVLGALLLLGLDLIHSRLRPSGSRRPTSGREARRS
jgi:hypothetical protein